MREKTIYEKIAKKYNTTPEGTEDGSDRNLAPDPDGSLLLSAAWCLPVPDSSGGAIVRGQRRWGICH